MLLMIVSMVAFVGCKEKTNEEKAADAVEDAKKEAGDAAEAGKEAAEDAAEAGKEALESIGK